MIRQYYREFKGITNELDQDGVPFSTLQIISSPKETRISKELSTIIVKMVTELKIKFEIKEILHFSNSTIGLFNTIGGPEIGHFYLCYGENSLEAFIRQHNQLILCDLSVEEDQVSPPPFQALNKCIKRLKENDSAIVAASEINLVLFRKIISENHAFISCIFYISLENKFSKLTQILEDNGSIFIPFESGIYLLLIQKKKPINEYISHIDSAKNLKGIIEECSLDNNSNFLIYGKIQSTGEYKGESDFQRSLKIKKALNAIENSANDYKSYPQKRICEVALHFTINEFKLNKALSKSGNYLYVNVKGFELENKDKPLFYRYQKFSLQPKQINKDEYFLSIELDIDKIESKYLKYFFDSKIGNLIIESTCAHEYLTLEDIKNFWIYMPPIELQREILTTIQKIDDTKKNLQDLNFDLVLNPSAFIDATNKINKILDVFGELADFDKIKSKIYEGESKTLEFKQTFSIDISTQKKEKFIVHACIKTIAAFLNSDGGTLLVGVSDNGNLVGLNDEITKFYKNIDGFLLTFKNAIRENIGAQYYPLINNRIVNVENKMILYVECLPSKSEVFIDKDDFYVRTNPATDKISGLKMMSYIRNRFNHS